jgi:hypothetical protein
MLFLPIFPVAAVSEPVHREIDDLGSGLVVTAASFGQCFKSGARSRHAFVQTKRTIRAIFGARRQADEAA